MARTARAGTPGLSRQRRRTDLIEAELKGNLELGWGGDPYVFVSILLDSRPEMASLLLDRILEHPEVAGASLVGLALSVELRFREQQGSSRVDTILGGTNAELRWLAARTIAWTARQGLASVPGGRERIKQLLRDHDNAVVQQGLLAIRYLAEMDPAGGSVLLETVEVTRSKEIAGEIASLFGSYGPLNWAELNPTIAARVLKGLTDLPDIDDFHVQQLLRMAARQEPERVVALLQQRVEHAESQPRNLTYRALPFEDLAAFEFPNSVLRYAVLQRVWEWMTKNTASWQRQNDGAKLWWSVAKPLDNDVLAFLLEKAGSAGTDYTVMGAILSGLPQTFVATNPEFVAEILDAAQREGDEPLRRAASGFHGSNFLGLRSRAIGVPDPQDVEFRDKFKQIAVEQRPGPTRDLYESMSADVEREIQYHAADDETMLDRHKW